MRQLLYIPEFVDLLSSHLDHATLAACVRVAKDWHELFIPHLWHTFGTFPSQPVRFGLQFSPSVKLPDGLKFPLYVSGNSGDQDTSDNLVPVFRDIKSDSYPNSRGFLRWKDDKWHQLFSGSSLLSPAEAAITPIVAKHAKYIRCLTIWSLKIFGIYEHVCHQLTSLSFGSYSDRNNLWEVERRLIPFVERQWNLRSIHLSHYFETRLSSLIQLNRDWLHFDVSLTLQAYRKLVFLLPYTRSVRLDLSSDPSRFHEIPDFRLHRPHIFLEDLEICTARFDHRALNDILQSFPNLRRLVVNDRANGQLLDLVIDKGGWSMLYVDPGLAGDLHQMLPLLPRLVGFTDSGLNEPYFEQLAKHCPHLVYYTEMYKKASEQQIIPLPVFHIGNGRAQHWPANTTPTATQSVSRLLACCPDLEEVECQRWPMRLEDITNAPWVCEKLKGFNCVFTTMPLLSPSEQMMYRALLTRYQKLSTVDEMIMPSDLYGLDTTQVERAVLDKASLLARYLVAIEDQLRRLPVLDMNTSYDISDVSLARHLALAKASIWPEC